MLKGPAIVGKEGAQGGPSRTPVSWIGLLIPIIFAMAPVACSDTCSVPLSASGCPATYEAIGFAACMSCGPSLAPCPMIGTCGEFLVYSSNGGYSGGTCYYDATTHKLVASRSFSDTNEFCDGSSFTIASGVSVGACQNPPASTLGPYCPATP